MELLKPARSDEMQEEATRDASAIFVVSQVEIEFDVASDFVAAQVSNDTLVLAMQNGKIMRIDLSNPAEIDDIELPRKVSEIGTIRRLFLDPTASHLIISTTLGDNFYLHAQSRVPKALTRLKGVQINCVAWNPARPTASSREILLGSVDGLIYEISLDPSTAFNRREEKYVKVVFQTDSPVCAIWVDSMPSAVDTRRVLLSTSTRLFYFLGKIAKPSSGGAGSVYLKFFEKVSPAVKDSHNDGAIHASALAFTPESPGGQIDVAAPERMFAWASDSGTLCGQLLTSPLDENLSARTLNEAQFFSHQRILQTTGQNQTAQSTFGLLLVLTQWHLLYMLDSRLVALNRLDGAVIYDAIILQSHEQPLALLADPKYNTYWLLTHTSIYEIKVQDEDRNIWKVLMKRGQFENALQYANNAAQQDAIATASGDHLLEQGRLIEAARVYGKSSKPFEEVALTLLNKADKDALRSYLIEKLSSSTKNLRMQRAMLTSWIIEIFMSKLNDLDDVMTTNTDLKTDQMPSEASERFKSVQKEFQNFIRRNRDDLNRATAYEVISSHGREEELLFFAATVNDHDYALSYWIQRENWDAALRMLAKQNDQDLIYQHSSVLFLHAASQFVDVLMRQASNLQPEKLIPACLNYNAANMNTPLSQNQALRYLSFEIYQNQSKNPSVHNTFISICAAHKSPDESVLLAYLESHPPMSSRATEQSSKQDLKTLDFQYDADFALRLCLHHARVLSCVLIYCAMSQYASAVSVALQYGHTDLAINVAERAEHDAPTRKRLWLAIARNVIGSGNHHDFSENQLSNGTRMSASEAQRASKPDTVSPLTNRKNVAPDIKTALSLLQRAPVGVLRMEDLLPLFPDFVLTDAVKDEVCLALESHSARVESLRQEMEVSAITAMRIRQNVRDQNKRWVLVEPGEECGICGQVLLDRRFWIWACGHGVHGDCLTRDIAHASSKAIGRRIKEIRYALEKGVEGNNREALVEELDSLLGRECPLCGEVAIRRIDEPFVSPVDDRGVWTI